MANRETKASFRNRVFVATGVRYADIPIGVHADVILHSVCGRGATSVVVAPYPTMDGDIIVPIPENYLRVHLGHDERIPE